MAIYDSICKKMIWHILIIFFGSWYGIYILAIKAVVNNSIWKSFDITFIENEKNYQNINYFLLSFLPNRLSAMMQCWHQFHECKHIFFAVVYTIQHIFVHFLKKKKKKTYICAMKKRQGLSFSFLKWNRDNPFTKLKILIISTWHYII